MKKVTVLLMSLGTLTILTLCAAEPATRKIAAQDREESSLRVGVFDSRALPIAFVHSSIHEEFMKQLRKDHEAATAAGDEARAAELEAKVIALQDRLHRQTFSTGSVTEILKHLEDEIPGIAKKAGVDLIVNRWDVVYMDEDAEFIDLTLPMVAPFVPGEQALRNIRELGDVEPLPLEETDWEALHDH